MVRIAWEVRPSIVEGGFHQIFKLARVFGSFPFSKEYQFSLWRFILSSILLVLSGFKMLSTMLARLKFVVYNNIFFLLWSCLCSYLVVLILITLSWPAIKATQLQIIRRKLNEIERTLQTFVTLRSKLKWYVLHFCFFVHTILIPCFSCTGMTISFILSFCFLEYTSFAVIIEACGFLSLIGILLSEIKYIKNINVQVELVNNITIVLKLVNDYYGFRFLLVTVGLILRLITCIFTVLKEGFNYYTTFSFLSTSICFLQFALLIISTNRIKSEFERLNQYFTETFEGNLNDEMLDFYLISKKEFTFTACGFFNYDQKIISSMIVCSVTYIVILLQQKMKIVESPI
ncbi:Gustatory receptor 134 [Halyomorpha halys]|nr:Gustatory receptor 134 [Halyomorpha halys]